MFLISGVQQIGSVYIFIGFPGGASGKEPACQCRRLKKLGFNPWVGEIPWRRTWKPTPVFLPEEFHGQELGSLQSIGSLRVGHNWSDLACIYIYMHSSSL